MRFGMYYFLQRPPWVSEAEVIRNEVEQMVWAEALGFGTVWLTEHHFADYGLSSAPNVLATAVLSRTERLQVGLAVYVLPFHDPICFAEEIATLDILSGGRLIVGIGRGNRPTEFAGYRVSQLDSRERLEEALEVVLAAWTQDRVEHDGRFFKIPGVPVHPRPITRPHPPLAVAATSPETTEWTARRGYRLLNSGLTTPLARTLEQRDLYQRTLRAYGHPRELQVRLLRQWTVTKHVYVAPTDAEAVADARPAHAWYLDSFVRSMQAANLKGLPPEIYAQAEKTEAGLRAHRWEDLIQHALLVGSPETVRGKVQELAEAGVGELACWMSFGGLPVDKVRRSMELFARDVMPAFQEDSLSLSHPSY